jgi:hypothetical protein
MERYLSALLILAAPRHDAALNAAWRTPDFAAG